MTLLFNGDCLEQMKNIGDNSVDLIFADLPYGQTSCKWDCLIDLDKWWLEVMRVKKLNTPIIMTCTTKFGVSLIQSAPKKCPFRYDLVWCKSSPCGFLSAKKMPMRKHEMIYVFYEKLPFYDLSSHKHKFIKERDVTQKNGAIYEGDAAGKKCMEGKYEPPLPTSLVKENKNVKTAYGETTHYSYPQQKNGESIYEPPLPTSLVKEDYENCNKPERKSLYGKVNIYEPKRSGEPRYEPPLPTSLVKEGQTLGDKGNECYGKFTYYNNGVMGYEPKLPTSLVEAPEGNVYRDDLKLIHYKDENGKRIPTPDAHYEPALPTSLLEIKSTRGKHSTEKPVALMEWILKYFSKKNDIVLDTTMGSGSMGSACINMGRNFIGIEKDEEIFTNAWERLNPE